MSVVRTFVHDDVVDVKQQKNGSASFFLFDEPLLAYLREEQ